MPDAGVLATILLIAGLFLLALELMIPSFGIIGILSAICLLVSAWSAWQAWWADSPGYFWTYAGFWVLGIPSVLGGTLFLLEHTSFGDRLVLRSGDPGTAISDEEQQQMDSLIGKQGVASSTLMPGGMVTVDGDRHHAESLGRPIDAGTCVEVVEIRGARLVVRACKPAENGPPAATQADPDLAHTMPENTVAADSTPSSELPGSEDTREDAVGSLDFEIPDN